MVVVMVDLMMMRLRWVRSASERRVSAGAQISRAESIIERKEKKRVTS